VWKPGVFDSLGNEGVAWVIMNSSRLILPRYSGKEMDLENDIRT